MNRLLPIVPVLFMMLMPSCTPTQDHFDEAPIRQVMLDQQAAWDRGDIPGFMEGYSDTICFIGKNGRTCGRQAVTANYERSYPSLEAMGDLTFTIIEVVPAGKVNAWSTGLWTLRRSDDTLSGGFSLLWALEDDGWRIVRDHSY